MLKEWRPVEMHAKTQTVVDPSLGCGSLGFEVVAIDVNYNGSLQVFSVGDALVVAGAFCTQDDDDGRDFDEEPPQALLDAMTAVAEAETVLVGTVNCPSGTLACLPSTASGKPFCSAMLSGAAVHVDLEVECGTLGRTEFDGPPESDRAVGECQSSCRFLWLAYESILPASLLATAS